MTLILIIDDHAVVRRGIRQTLKEEIRDAVFGEAGNASEALKQAARRPWDIAIVDTFLPDRNGFAVLEEIRRRQPGIKVLVLGVDPEDWYEVRARQLGARGYISKSASLDELLRAVRRVVAGKQHFSRAALPEPAAGVPHAGRSKRTPATLSIREREILLALAAGQRVGRLADELGLSIKTVSTYKRRVLNKLRVNSTAGLVRYAIDHGIQVRPV